MDPKTGLSDEAMALRWGGILNEVPELWDALRRYEIKNRPCLTSGGFAIKADWVSVGCKRGMLRLQVGNSGR